VRLRVRRRQGFVTKTPGDVTPPGPETTGAVVLSSGLRTVVVLWSGVRAAVVFSSVYRT